MKRLGIGLALSGGTARSVAHIGAIKALVENDIPIDYIAGTSGGAIAATAYAANLSIESMERIAMELKWSKLGSLKFSRLGIISSKPIEELMIDMFKSDIQFSDLSIPCAVVATDLNTGSRRIFHSGPIAKCVRISCCLPHLFLPVDYENQTLVDGGLSEYLPIQTVRDLGAKFTIGINLGAQAGNYKKPKHILSLFMQVNNLVAKQNMRQSSKQADFLIEPQLNGFSAFDFNNTKKLIDLLYETTLEQIDEIKRVYEVQNNLFNRIKSNLPYQKRINSKLNKLITND